MASLDEAENLSASDDSDQESLNSLRLTREFIPKRLSDAGDANSFSVLSYNVLADCHIRENYYTYLPEDQKAMEHRHRQVIQELQHYSPDVVCLQEVGVDYFHRTLKAALAEQGYQAVFQQKSYRLLPSFYQEKGVKSPTSKKMKVSEAKEAGLRQAQVSTEMTPEGLATFYKKSRFEFLEERQITVHERIKELLDESSSVKQSFKREEYPMLSQEIASQIQRDTVFLYTKLRCKRTGKKLNLGNVHLWFGRHGKEKDLQTLQTVLAVNELHRFVGGRDPLDAHILCGDFNFGPQDPGYSMVDPRNVPDPVVQRNQEELMKCPSIVVTKTNEKGQQTKESQQLYSLLGPLFKVKSQPLLESSYKSIMSREPNFTNYHQPKDGDQPFRGTLDYIWFSFKSLKCTQVLETPPEDSIERVTQDPFPNAQFPSDHILIMGAYSFI